MVFLKVPNQRKSKNKEEDRVQIKNYNEEVDQATKIMIQKVPNQQKPKLLLL